VSSRAYTKVMLHACKYPHKAVNGVLLGREVEGGDLQLLDAIPLFHQCLGLKPMLEIALMQVDTHCKQQHGELHIVGYYQANEHVDHNVPDLIACKIADKISEHTTNSVMFIVDNNEMDTNIAEKPALKMYTLADGKWRENSHWNLIGEHISLSHVSKLIGLKTYKGLIDFDNHLDDISLDWLNTGINKVVDMTPS